MRVGVCYEGVPTSDGRLIETHALRLLYANVRDVPVTARVGRELFTGSTRVGSARAFRRDQGTGVVSAEVTIAPAYVGRVDPGSMNAHLEIRDAEWEDRDGLMVVTNGLIGGLHLSDGPHGWPDLDRLRPLLDVDAPTVGAEVDVQGVVRAVERLPGRMLRLTVDTPADDWRLV